MATRTPFDQVEEVKGKYEELLLAIPGVTGVGIGQIKTVSNTVYYIRIYTESQETAEKLRSLLRTKLHGIPIVYIVTGRIVAF